MFQSFSLAKYDFAFNLATLQGAAFSPKRRFVSLVLVACSLFLAGCGNSDLAVKADFEKQNQSKTQASSPTDDSSQTSAQSSQHRVRVEVIHPDSQGIKQTISQPGSCQAFEVVQLFAKVSGYLKNQKVDIGSKVKQGEVLAEIDAPEIVHAVMEAKATVAKAEAQINQKDAAIAAAKGDQTAAEAEADQAQADLQNYQAMVTLRKEQYDRMKDLADKKAVQQELVDEKFEAHQAALSEQAAGRKAIATAKAKVAAAKSHVEEAKADLAASKAAKAAAEASLKKSQQYEKYLKITAPFDGVITVRNYYNGDFVKECDGRWRAAGDQHGDSLGRPQRHNPRCRANSRQ